MASPKILIADDDKGLLAALTARLQANGFDVVTTQDAYQALDFVRRLKPDLVILDVNMPAGKGFSVQQRMRAIPEIADIPVMYLTGVSPDRIDASAERLGAAAVVYKPFDTQELIATIWSVLDRGPTSGADERAA